jgi:hypothetical protein
MQGEVIGIFAGEMGGYSKRIALGTNRKTALLFKWRSYGQARIHKAFIPVLVLS